MSSALRSGFFFTLGLAGLLSCTTGVVGTPVVSGGDTGQRGAADQPDGDTAGDSGQDTGQDSGPDSGQDSAQDSGLDTSALNSGRDTDGDTSDTEG